MAAAVAPYACANSTAPRGSVHRRDRVRGAVSIRDRAVIRAERAAPRRRGRGRSSGRGCRDQCVHGQGVSVCMGVCVCVCVCTYVWVGLGLVLLLGLGCGLLLSAIASWERGLMLAR